MEYEIGEIGNYYGGLTVKAEGNNYYWSIEDWQGHRWEQISESLYNELLKHNDKLAQKEG